MGRAYESYWGRSTGPKPTTMAAEWDKLKRSNQDAKLICIDITPHTTTQVENNPDVLNIGAFPMRCSRGKRVCSAVPAREIGSRPSIRFSSNELAK